METPCDARPIESLVMKLRDEVGEEKQQEGGGNEGQLLALEVAGAARGHARDQWHAQSHAAEKAADMCVVIDVDDTGEVGGEADDQVQHSELDNGPAETIELEGRYGEFFVGEQDDEDAGDAEDRARGSCTDRNAVASVHVGAETEQVAGDAGDQIH